MPRKRRPKQPAWLRACKYDAIQKFGSLQALKEANERLDAGQRERQQEALLDDMTPEVALIRRINGRLKP